jgi:DNA ligase (NAD+)
MNPRNTASGSLKMQDSAEVRKRGLSAVFYQYIAEEFPAKRIGNFYQKPKNGVLKFRKIKQNCVKHWMK